jgi:hypothetical protein
LKFYKNKTESYTTQRLGQHYIYNNLKNNIMGTALKCKMIVLVMTTLFLCSCGGHRMKGSASDRTGTNGATNGTGKIPR